MINTCKKCGLSETIPNIIFDKKGECSICEKEKMFNKNYNQKLYIKKMEEMFEEAKSKKRLFDAIVMLSGGKDSVYLIYYLKKKYNLKILALSIIHPFLNKLSARNMEITTKKMGVDLMKFYIDEKLFKSFIKIVIPIAEERKLGPHFGCDACNFFKHNVSMNIAIKLKIPLYCNGYDKNQTPPIILNGENKIFYNIFYEKYNIIFDENFSEYKDSIYNFDFTKYKINDIPNIVLPLTFIDYNKDKARQELHDQKIINYKKLDFQATNCKAMWLFNYYSMQYYSTPLSMYSIAKEIRKTGFYINPLNNKKYTSKTIQNIADDLDNKLICQIKKSEKYYAKYFNIDKIIKT